ncbi:MAG: DUF1343 domain-containing protein, partial [Candidatus Marinimicrobia bacterium]|nr:DUF1343 domain-containing protein [Candidatus Neomarinimicrobiota bacterium]MBT3496192.1 DUF1343 domain-containing protein [Candidatus Neomarinimicrobiota bacterium]MBT3691686.1 DUF1343 domain-containing protein [Candidatus Neomarinimicrobiota bacterium]MBT3732217.1 DUF1343 domain-containing protein [Candidatus Neomarinimicrobiota bacterium]MBT4143665.1 DUF1343 domain-containing protein [Candidatus Neomarinimicrobiota bacterium]
MKHIASLSFLIFMSCQSPPISIHQTQSLMYQNRETPPNEIQSVQTGLDVLLDSLSEELKGKSIALVTNHTGIDKKGIPNYKRLMALDGIDLNVIFSPEHGLFGEAAAGEKVNYDGKEIPLPEVISLYGKNRKPSPDMLEEIDLILYDIQDIGARFYTYITTLGLVMESAGELDIPIWILDRPNPIRGDKIEGPILDMNFQTFVGYYPIPIRYGGTVGDLGKKIIQHKWINTIPELRIIPMTGWSPSLWFDETDLPWIKPSPNIPDLETAIIYPGMCLLEGTNVSEGRGTQHPFKWFGAPWIESQTFSQALNKLNLPGVVFIPKSFTPKTIEGMAWNPKFENQLCQGIEIKIIDRDIYESVDVGVQVLHLLNTMYPEQISYKEKHFNRLWGSD